MWINCDGRFGTHAKHYYPPCSVHRALWGRLGAQNMCGVQSSETCARCGAPLHACTVWPIRLCGAAACVPLATTLAHETRVAVSRTCGGNAHALAPHTDTHPHLETHGGAGIPHGRRS